MAWCVPRQFGSVIKKNDARFTNSSFWNIIPTNKLHFLTIIVVGDLNVPFLNILWNVYFPRSKVSFFVVLPLLRRDCVERLLEEIS